MSTELATPRKLLQTAEPILEVRNLSVHFPFRRGNIFNPVRGVIRAVHDVSLSIQPGQTFGLVGESGCGKSTLARAVVRLASPTKGEVYVQGQRVDNARGAKLVWLRRMVQMVFQDPYASLNPRMSIGRTIREPMRILKLHHEDSRQQELRAIELMDQVGLSPKLYNRYPHELSGGQRQRVGIARALAVEPKLLVCDEPVSALDVSIQAQVINLLMDLQKQMGLSYLFIAHDLSVIRHISDVVGVMYLGRLVEVSPAAELYARPRHPYTQALLSAVPLPDPVLQRQRKRTILRGEVPRPDREYKGCAFAERCPLVEAACHDRVPQLTDDPHRVACFVAERTSAG